MYEKLSIRYLKRSNNSNRVISIFIGPEPRYSLNPPPLPPLRTTVPSNRDFIDPGTGGVIYMYIAETSPTSSRPFYLLMFTLNVGMGMMAAAALGASLGWRAMAAVFSVSSVAGFAAPFLVPGTPMWLRSRGRDEDARRAELWFGFALPRVDRAVAAAMPPPPACPSAAIATLGRADSTVEAATERMRAASEPGGRGWAAYARPAVWKPALVALAFFCCQQASGFYVLLFYAVDVLRDCRVPVDGMTAAVYLSAARLAGTVASMLFQAAPKRTMTAVSGLGMCAALSAAIVYYGYAGASGRPPTQGSASTAAADYLMLVPFLLYVFFAMLAVLPLPWSVCGEMFPMPVKGTMNGVLYSCGYELMFAAIKSYPLLVATFGVRPVWTAFAGSCFVTAAFGAFVLPETTGKTLEEITAGFEPRPVATAATVVNKHARPGP